MTAIYNEIEPFPAEWLRNLSAAGLIAEGRVNERSIEDLEPADVAGASQFHAFAGVGVWSYALRLAGVPDDAPVWTGSCPCQPFSVAGKGRGVADHRHLWPAWFRLIRECRPPVVFGEQVASPAGRDWLDLVSADLEGVGYAVGAADLCAAGIGAPHIRQRLFFVAVADRGQRDRLSGGKGRERDGEETRRLEGDGEPERRGEDGILGHPGGEGSGRHPGAVSGSEGASAGAGSGARRLANKPELAGDPRRMGEPPSSGRSRLGEEPEHGESGQADESWIAHGGRDVADATEPRSRQGGAEDEASIRRASESGRAGGGATRGPWHPADWLPCRDGKLRPVEPGTFPLAHGAPARVGRLRAYGNAIVPQVAAEFVRSAFWATTG